MGGLGSGRKSSRGSVDGKRPTCPDYVQGRGRELWERIVSSLQVAGTIDSSIGDHVAAYVSAVLEVENCEGILAEEGLTQTNSISGVKTQHPCVITRNTAVQRMCRLGSQIGITNFNNGRSLRKPIHNVGDGQDKGDDLALKLYERANKKRKASGG